MGLYIANKGKEFYTFITMHETPILWTPNQEYSLAAEYPIASDQELAEKWGDYTRTDAENLDTYDSFLGVTRPPESTPSLIVSVDLCEVLRMTHASLRTVEEPFGTPFAPEPYGNGMQSMRSATDVVSVAQVLINHDLIRPVDEINYLAGFLQRWKRLGAYIVANTSTSEGCELGTVNFLQNFTPNSFDGILFPRNHDGTGKVTKGLALRSVVDRYIETDQTLDITHIDDAHHHLEALPKAFSDRPMTEIATFQPLYTGSLFPAHEGSTHGETPFETFVRADEYITSQLVSRASLND